MGEPATVSLDEIDLPTLVSLAGAVVNEHLLEALRRVGFEGIRLSHGYVIQRLLGDEPTVGELAEALGITQQAVSKTVGEMAALGLVTRRPDPGDQRIRRIALSQRGRDVLDAGRRERRRLESAVGASDDDVAAARRVLAALLQAGGGLEAARRRRARPVVD